MKTEIGLITICLLAFLALAQIGCAPALVGGGAVGAYKVGTDERTVGNQLDDSLLNGKVRAALVSHSKLKSINIDTDTLRRIVYLTGVVENREQAALAEQIAVGVEGVSGVVNDLQVGSLTAGRRLDDLALTSKIKAKLIKEESVRSLSVDVDTVRGVVHLLGIVDNPGQAQTILKLVDETDGVRAIKNHLVSVRPQS